MAWENDNIDQGFSFANRNVGKKPRKFQYTYQTIADILGLQARTVREYARRGDFNPNSLLSVIKFVCVKKGIQSI